MSGEKKLDILLKAMKPKLNEGEFVFCEVESLKNIDIDEVLMTFKEQESITVILEKKIADKLHLKYAYISSWITLTVHSSLEAVGLTAAFSKALSENGISCNVVAAFYHDHIFVDQKDAVQAMEVLNKFSQ